MDLEHPTIFLVDDNPDIKNTLKLALERKKFKVITADNGLKGLEILIEATFTPDIIISDIMMPEMNGYEFFQNVSNDPRLSMVPFVFLSARSSDMDVRLGKIVGADDYITKPFKLEDLLAIIQGKINHSKNIARINEKFGADEKPRPQTNLQIQDRTLFLLEVFWDDKMGPMLKNYYPLIHPLPFSLQEISFQLYSASTAIYGKDVNNSASGVLLSLSNISRKAYVYFDYFPDETTRAKSNLFMVGVIAPRISYIDSLSIKKICDEIASLIKARKKWNIKQYHEIILTAMQK